MLGCVPLGSVSGLHPDEEMLLLWVQGGTALLFRLVCAYFPELQGWEGVAGKLPSVSGMVQVAELFHRLVALNSVKVMFCSCYPEVRLYSSSSCWKYGTQSCWSSVSS